MKIAYLGAGAAGRYCGTCLHDNTLATALVARGEDVLLIPMYTPIRTDEPSVSQSRVFFGGVNVYLQQQSALFRHTPWFVDGLLNSPRLLDWLSNRSAGMAPAKLGALTVSTLQGERGRQRKELEKLVRWLAEEIRPDVVHLSNVMLCGAVRRIKQTLGVPVVSSLAGEDIFIEQLQQPHYGQARELMKERAGEIDRFVALNHYFADFMSDYLAVDRSKIDVIRHGLQLAGHGRGGQPTQPVGDNRPHHEVTIGYFARVAAEKGLHLLVEALVLLAQDTALPPWRLRVAGYMSSADKIYFDAIAARVRAAGLHDQFEFVGEVDRQGKIDFLKSIDLLSVPTVYRESKGISVIEALANGVPVVLPAHGTFPELIADTGGGILHAPEDPRAIADAIKTLLLDPGLRAELGRRGEQSIHARYNATAMAADTVEFYRRVLSSHDTSHTALSTVAPIQS